jgi:hypothetical protein
MSTKGHIAHLSHIGPLLNLSLERWPAKRTICWTILHPNEGEYTSSGLVCGAHKEPYVAWFRPPARTRRFMIFSGALAHEKKILKMSLYKHIQKLLSLLYLILTPPPLLFPGHDLYKLDSALSLCLKASLCIRNFLAQWFLLRFLKYFFPYCGPLT